MGSPNMEVPPGGGCRTHINVFTALACQHTPSCRVPNTNIDLSPLMDFEKNFWLDENDGATYLGVCKTLAGQSDLKCPEHAAICQKKSGASGATVSYGIPDGPPQFKGTGKYELKYVNGSKCKGEERFSSSIVFTCQRNTYPGSPIHNSASSTRCHMVYDWATLLACHNATIPMVPSGSNNCSFKRPDYSQPIDLSHIKAQTAQNPSFVSKRHSVQPCGVNPKCGGSVCESQGDNDWVSLGKITSASLNLNNDEVVLQVGSGSNVSCHGSSQLKTAEIRFVCDMSLTECTGSPVHEFSLPCHEVFRWRTKLVCPDADQECPRETGQVGRFAFGQSSNRSAGYALISILWSVAIVGTAFLTLAFISWRRPGGVLRQMSQVRSRLGRGWGTIRTGHYDVAATSDHNDDHFLISGDIQVPTFGSLAHDEDEELILA